MSAPLTDTQQRILVALLEEPKGRPMTGNELGDALGFQPGQARHGNHGRGNVARTMGVAVHVTPGITGLRRRGLIRFGARPDGLTGTADGLTDEGEEKARELRAAGVTATGGRG